jgi:hypothetical protein
MIKYSEEFAKMITAEYPHNNELHKALDEGRNDFINILDMEKDKFDRCFRVWMDEVRNHRIY